MSEPKRVELTETIEKFLLRSRLRVDLELLHSPVGDLKKMINLFIENVN